MRILIADDEEVSRAVLQQSLHRLGHEVLVCKDGDEVMSYLFKGELPQLLFLDWMMPGIPGTEICKEIRRRQDLKFTYIVLVTSKNETQDIIEGLRSGANDYITKPVDLQELGHRLSVALQILDLNQLVEHQRIRMIGTAKKLVLGEMARGMAHEINNPLAIVMGHLQLMESKSKSGLPLSQFTDQIQAIQTAGRRIARIVNALRSFAGDAENESIQETKIESFIDDCLLFFSARLKNAEIELQVPQVDPTWSFEIRRNQMIQAILNLIENSCEAVSKLDEKWIKIETHADPEFIHIAIVDSGRGIPEESRSRLMQPFFTTRDIGKGTGLGLSVSLGILRSHGGDLKLDETSANTRFVLSIPKLRRKKS